MRVQLRKLFLVVLCVASVLNVGAQKKDKDSTKLNLDPIEVNILSSYYRQDGNHSPVTGGQGTEQLSNIAPTVYVHIPLDSVSDIDINAGVDFYSSASSDNIDNPYLSSKHISGASSADIRQYYSLSYSKENEKKSRNSYTIGASSEYDVTSLSAGFSFEKENRKKQRGFSLGAKYFFDDWKLIYPVELRNGTKQYLTQDKRHTLGVMFSEMFIINKRLKGSFTIEGIGQYGLLSTPFHRVYFVDEFLPKVEMLPSIRIRTPMALRLNAHLGSRLILRTFNRMYWDSWGVMGYTFELETPIKTNDWLRVYPIYRFHIQSQADYFNTYGQHKSTSNYYTSDFDLSQLHSHKFGFGTNISPLFGLARFKRKKGNLVMWKGLDLRYVYYMRSDGLTAWNVTMGLEFKIDRK